MKRFSHFPAREAPGGPQAAVAVNKTIREPDVTHD